MVMMVYFSFGVLLLVYQLIGVFELFKFVGIVEQKWWFLLWCVVGVILVFLLIEFDVGFDLVCMVLMVMLIDDGQVYEFEGVKLWIINGVVVDLLVVMVWVLCSEGY